MKEMKRKFGGLRVLTLLLLIVAAGMTMISVGKIKKNPGAREKARYYYRQALLAQVDSSPASAYELYKLSYASDPTYAEAASALGQNRLGLNLDTMRSVAEIKRSVGMMKQFVDAYPGDINEAAYYAFVCTRIDSIDEAERVYKRIYSQNPQYTQLLTQLADLYMVKGETAKAIEQLDRYEREEGSSPELTLKKISYMLHAKDTVSAIAEVDRLVKKNPREPVYHILRGNLYDILNMPDSVEQNYLRAEAVAPESGAPKMALAALYEERGDSVRYDKMTYEALMSEDLELEDKVGLLEVFLGSLLENKSDMQRGDTLFSVLSRQYPHQEVILDLSARYSYAKGDYVKAIEDIDYAIGLSPTSERYWNQKLSFTRMLGLPDEVKKVYAEAKKHLQPSEIEKMKLSYVVALLNDDDNERAIKNIEESLKEFDSNLPARGKVAEVIKDPSRMATSDRYGVGQIYAMLGDLRQQTTDSLGAYEAYDNSLYLLPDNAMTLNNYAYFLAINDGDLEKAKRMSKQAIDLMPDNPTFIDTYAWILYLTGDYEEARRYQDSAIELSQSQDGSVASEYYQHLADILERLSLPEEAAEAREKASEAVKAEKAAEAEEVKKSEETKKEFEKRNKK